MALYELRRYWSSGEPIDVITAMESLDITRLEGDIGKLTFTLPYNSLFAASIEKMQELQVYRKGKQQFDTRYLIKDWREYTDAQGMRKVSVYAEDLNSLLWTRIIAYHASSPQADKTGAADDVMKAIVRENMGTLATADRQIAGLVVDPDFGDGRSVKKAFAWQPVGSVLQGLSEMTRKDNVPVLFDLHGSTVGRAQFSTYASFLGNDRRRATSTPLLIGEKYGNLAGSTAEHITSEEATAIYAGGQGQEDERIIKQAVDENRIIAALPYGRIERFRDARNVEVEQSIEDQAKEALGEAVPYVRISGRLVETAGCRYDVDFRFGDIVDVEAYGQITACRIAAVGLSYSGGAERIDVHLEGVIK